MLRLANSATLVLKPNAVQRHPAIAPVVAATGTADVVAAVVAAIVVNRTLSND